MVRLHSSLLVLGVSTLMSGVTAAPLPDFLGHIIPDTIVIDGYRLLVAKVALKFGDRTLNDALQHLTTQADYWLTQGPWSVTTKSQAPPGGTIHDYASQAPYWWPSDTPDGCPYVQRDGERNPEVDNYPDHTNRGLMFNSSYILTLAWYYTGREEYALHAGDILRTWFLDPATSMNPNLDHAQIIPCANTGRSIGGIDFSQEYTNVIDAAAILSSAQAPGWSSSDVQGFKSWNVQFLNWLATSDFGIEEANATNNHGTFANMEIAAIAKFVGNDTLAKSRCELAKTLIDTQITANGSQPQELARTRSFHYSNFNLGAHLRFALIAKKYGIDLFRYQGPQGQTLLKAADFVIPAAVGGASQWPYPELSFTPYAATDNLHAAADALDFRAAGVVNQLPPPPAGDIYAVRPAPEQLDNIADS